MNEFEQMKAQKDRMLAEQSQRRDASFLDQIADLRASLKEAEGQRDAALLQIDELKKEVESRRCVKHKNAEPISACLQCLEDKGKTWICPEDYQAALRLVASMKNVVDAAVAFEVTQESCADLLAAVKKYTERPICGLPAPVAPCQAFLPCTLHGVADKRKHEHKYIGRQCECGKFKALEPLEGPGSVDE